MKTLKKPSCFLSYDSQMLDCQQQGLEICRKCYILITYEYYYQCPDCGKVFFTKEDYEDHQKAIAFSQNEGV